MRDRRRDTLTVLSDLLQNMKEPRRITNLLYTSNLSYAQLTKYLKMIKVMGLALEKSKPFRSFIVTDDGEFFINMVKRREVPPIECEILNLSK